MSAKLGGKTKKQYGKRGFSRLFCHVFRKKTFLRAFKGKINAKSPADAEILRAGCLWVFIYEKSGADYLTL